MLRFLLWRLLGLLALLGGGALIGWFLDGGPGKLLRGSATAGGLKASVASLPDLLDAWAQAIGNWAAPPECGPVGVLIAFWLIPAGTLAITRWGSRRRRRYVRLSVEPYRGDRASAEAIVTMFEALHKRLLRRWWRRLLHGQPGVALELHCSLPPLPSGTVGEEDRVRSSADGMGRSTVDPDRAPARRQAAWLAVSCPEGLERMVEADLRSAYPNCRLGWARDPLGAEAVLRLKRR